MDKFNAQNGKNSCVLKLFNLWDGHFVGKIIDCLPVSPAPCNLIKKVFFFILGGFKNPTGMAQFSQLSVDTIFTDPAKFWKAIEWENNTNSTLKSG